jgi:hypothetical protein
LEVVLPVRWAGVDIFKPGMAWRIDMCGSGGHEPGMSSEQ